MKIRPRDWIRLESFRYYDLKKIVEALHLEGRPHAPRHKDVWGWCACFISSQSTLYYLVKDGAVIASCIRSD